MAKTLRDLKNYLLSKTDLDEKIQRTYIPNLKAGASNIGAAFNRVGDMFQKPQSSLNVLSPTSLRGGMKSVDYLNKNIKSPFVNIPLSAGKELMKTYEQGFSGIGKGIDQASKGNVLKGAGNIGLGTWNLAKTPIALAGGKVPALAAGGISGLLSGGMAGLNGGNISEAAGKGFTQGLQTRALTRFTDPLIGKAVNQFSPLKNILTKQIAQRGVAGAGNVGEDYLLSKLDQSQYGKADAGLSFLIGAASAGNVELLNKLIKKNNVPKETGDSLMRLVKDRVNVENRIARESRSGNNAIIPELRVKKDEIQNRITDFLKSRDSQRGAINVGKGIEGVKQNIDDVFGKYKNQSKKLVDLKRLLPEQEKFINNALVKGMSTEDAIKMSNEMSLRNKLPTTELLNRRSSFDDLGNPIKQQTDINTKIQEPSQETINFANKGAIEQREPPTSQYDPNWVNKALDKMPINQNKNALNIKPETPVVSVKPETPLTFKDTADKVKYQNLNKAATKATGTQKLEDTLLNKKEFNSIPDRKSQIEYTKSAQENVKNITTYIDSYIKKNNIDQADWVDNFTSGGNKYPRLNQLHEKLVTTLHSYSKDFDENVGDLGSKYFPQKASIDIGNDAMKEVENGLWISQADMELGNFMTRTGKIDDNYIKNNYKGVMDSYTDQFVTRNYIKNLKPETKLQENVLGYSKQVSNAMKTGDNVNKINVPDFIGEAQSQIPATKRINYKVGDYGGWVRTNDNIMSHIGGDVWKAWQNLRDVEISDNWRTNKFKQNKALQNFIEVVAQHKFQPSTQYFLNEQIALKTSRKAAYNSILDTVGNFITMTFTRAHLGLSGKTAALQLLETTKLPAVFSPKAIAKGTSNLKNPVEWKRVNSTYGLNEFNNAYDLKRASGIKGTVQKGVEKFDDVIFLPMQKAEQAKNVIYAAVAEQEGISKGLSDKELRTFVRDNIFRYANVASPNNRAKLFEKTLGRLIFQYSQYNLKNLQSTSDLLKNKDYAKATGLLGSQVANLVLISASTGLPLSFLASQLVPLNVGPVFTFTKDLITELESKRDDETKKNRIGRLLVKNTVPTGTQAVRTKEGLAASKGYDLTSTGKVNYYGDKATPLQTGYAGLMGKNSLKMVRDFYDKDKYAMNKDQSKYFLEGTESQRKDLVKARDESQKEREISKKMKEDFEKGNTVKGEKIGNKIPVLDKETGYVHFYDMSDPEEVKDYNYKRMKIGEIKPGYEEGGYVYSKTKSGTNTRTETKLTVDPPEYTGNPLLDKQIKQEYKGAISSKENDILRLYQLKYLTEEEAINALAALEQSGQGYGVSGGTAKPKKTSITRGKITSNFKPKNISIAATPKFKFKTQLKKFKFA